MKALVVTPKNNHELKFITSLLNKLGINSSIVNKEELEDVGIAKILQTTDKTKKVSRTEIMNKLSV